MSCTAREIWPANRYLDLHWRAAIIQPSIGVNRERLCRTRVNIWRYYLRSKRERSTGLPGGSTSFLGSLALVEMGIEPGYGVYRNRTI